jgi:membrane protease YdiL (CAAX protease family)
MSIPALLSTLAALAQTVNVALGARLALAAVTLPLLHRALRDDSQPAPDAPEDAPKRSASEGFSIARRAGFALLGAFVLFMLTANWVPEERGPDGGRAFQAFVKGVMNYRLSFTPLAAQNKEATPAATVADLRDAARYLPQSAYFHRYLGIVLATRGQYGEALKSFDAGTRVLSQRAPERAEEEQALWHRLFGPVPPAQDAVAEARRKLEAYRLGWIGRVAVLAAYERIGAKAVAAGLREEVRAEARGDIWGASLANLSLLALVPQLGLIALVVGIILARTGVLRPAPVESHPTAHILWEGFILYLALYLSPLLFVSGGRRPSPETQPNVVAWLLVSSDIAQALAVLYLWWRLHRRGLTLAELGLTTRHLRANLLVGVAAAMVVTPCAFLIGIITEQVSQRLFPHIAPPFHPLSIYTATSGSIEIRAALFFGAVIGAPLLEETFFRGALFGALRRRHGYWPAILGSASFFAILHPQLPLGFLPIAVIGGAFAALYHWRQSLVPGMVAHAVNNGLIFLTLMLSFPVRK